MEWYPVTEELNNNILLFGTNNNWSIRLSSLFGEVWYSSQMPKPGDYIRVKTIVNPNYFSRQSFSFSFNGCFDVVWVSGRFNVPYHWGADITFSGCDGVADNSFGCGPRDYPREDEINKNIGKAFVTDSISSTNENETYFVFRVLGSHDGVNINEYLFEDCANYIEQQTSIATFEGSLISEAFKKNSQDYYTYYTPVIKVSGQYYIWKNLTEGYVLFTCTEITVEQHEANTILLPSDVIASIPEISGHDATLEKLLNGIINSETGDADLAMASLIDNLTSIVSNISLVKQTPIGTTIDAAIGAFLPTLSTLGINFTSVVSTLQNELGILIDTILTSEGKTQDAIFTYVKQLFADIELREQQNKEYLASQVTTDLKAYTDQKVREIITNTQEGEPLPEFVQNIIDAIHKILDDTIGELLRNTRNSLQTVYDVSKDDIKKLWTGLDSALTDLANGKINTQDEWENKLREAGVSVSLIHLAQSVFSFLPMFSLFLGSQLDPIRRNIAHTTNAKFRPMLNDPSTVIAAYYKGGIDGEDLHKELAKHGLSDDRIKVLLRSAVSLLSPGTIQFAYLRGVITEQQHDKELQKYGYSIDEIATIKELYNTVPPIQDIIRFSVREAFTPEIAEQFGQYDDYPQKVEEYAKLLGLSPEFTKMYWASHWDLPSPTMGYEMLHRGIINKDQLKLLLRALDIMPFWREKLIELSYRPLTRVDVRRMYSVGVLDRSGVLKAYKDIGYDDYNAEKMTQFTVTYEAMQNDDGLNERKHLTRSIIELAFSRGVISEADALSRLINIGYVAQDAILLLNVVKYKDLANTMPDVRLEYRNKTAQAVKDSYLRRLIIFTEAKSRLMALGYTDLEAQQELNYIDLDYSVKVKSTISSYIKKVYTERTITRLEAQSMLTSFGYNGTEQERLFDEMDLVRELRDNKPTYAQFKQMVKSRIITVDEFIEEIRGLGYHDKYVEWLTLLDAPEA